MPRSRRTSAVSALAALAAGALLLAGCSAGTGTDGPATPTTSAGRETPGAVPSGLEKYYGQEVAWEGCGEKVECADVSVPLDYDNPGAKSITIAVKRLLSAEDGARVGNLLVNPGGPGSPGTDLADPAFANQRFSEDLRAAYDIVGFDPRGVGASAPIDCVSDAELDRIRAADYDTDTEEGLAAYAADTELIAEGCAAKSGDELSEVDTVSAAKDMDVLRAVLGETTLDYLGYSYGTYLGATYAEQFPKNVGHFVLDGAMDPSLDSHETTLAQAVGFEDALRAYVEDCLAGSLCPLSGTVDDGVGQIRTLLQVTADTPLPTSDGRELTASLAFAGIIAPLYDSASWVVLSQALDQAMHDGDGSTLLYLADLMAGRKADGTYPTNTTEANWAINCADFGAEGNLATWKAEAKELEKASPTFGSALSYSEMLCADWPGAPTGERAPIAAAGAPPIMVVGTTGDPATPYEWSQALADQLDSGFLVTYEGEGHTAYGRSNACITSAVDRFLIDGEKPVDGLTC
ncbi:alpha/beta hydrolase [Georgenia sp. SYP-B2076]|uniref:alpha/beta hydrolase n=1 Tax=Georgenia sp. SYP-B2076 TaxID=2495881 RepID=UPI000F8ED070|nr:alpha/beta hydrolase [Georgenia sp. SYP-B2076]